MKLKHNLFQLAVAFDQFLNVLVCMIIEPNSKHWADETFSSHTYRHYRAGEWVWLYHLINKVFFLQQDHCKEAYESEQQRQHEPPELRSNED